MRDRVEHAVVSFTVEGITDITSTGGVFDEGFTVFEASRKVSLGKLLVLDSVEGVEKACSFVIGASLVISLGVSVGVAVRSSLVVKVTSNNPTTIEDFDFSSTTDPCITL